MSRAARSIYTFAWYVAILGGVLLIAPGTVLPIFGLSVEGESWIRVLGFVLCSSAFNYFQAARIELEVFFRWTVVTRGLVPLVMFVLVTLKLVPALFLLMGIVDGLGGLWTWLALRRAASS